MTNGGNLLRRGRGFDPECSRTTHRLRVGRTILASLGVEAVWPEHDDKCICNPLNSYRRVFGYTYTCQCGVGTDPRPTWPEWVSDEIFDAAYALADLTQRTRGEFHQRQINEARNA